MIGTPRSIPREWDDGDRDDFLAMCDSPAATRYRGLGRIGVGALPELAEDTM